MAARRTSASTNGSDGAVYAYRATQRLSHPFCVLRDTRFSPPYCPSYAFHASDLFAWTHPQQTDAFNYSFSAADGRYGELINAHFAVLVRDGVPLPEWRPVSEHASSPVHDGLPQDWTASQLRLPDAPAIAGESASRCALWLSGGWYERIGLIN